ncbi:cation:proton antiporter [Streptomyces sp.]|uniref:cation:proton antiporter domain-containing protein n=1 Tax=Streptomyces sp. TaxID=1931 RepID=UPI0039C94A98
MGEIMAGLALGPSLLGLLPGNLTEVLFPPSARPYLDVLAQVGLVLFMFGVGYRFDLSPACRCTSETSACRACGCCSLSSWWPAWASSPGPPVRRS